MNLITRLGRRCGGTVSKQVQMFALLIKKNATSDMLVKGRRNRD